MTLEERINAVNDHLLAIRAEALEPVLLHYGTVNIEIRPAEDDDRVNVCKVDWGFTTVNYTNEGVIVDVYDENADCMQSLAIPRDDLELPEAP